MTSKSLFNSPLFVGFEPLLKQMEAVGNSIPAFPPYNIKKKDENHYVIEMAVAGFGKSDIDIQMKDDRLSIKGSVEADDDESYIHKGIAGRKFARDFTISQDVEVKDAELVNGMLKIYLERLASLPNIKNIEIKEKD